MLWGWEWELVPPEMVTTYHNIGVILYYNIQENTHTHTCSCSFFLFLLISSLFWTCRHWNVGLISGFHQYQLHERCTADMMFHFGIIRSWHYLDSLGNQAAAPFWFPVVCNTARCPGKQTRQQRFILRQYHLNYDARCSFGRNSKLGFPHHKWTNHTLGNRKVKWLPSKLLIICLMLSVPALLLCWRCSCFEIYLINRWRQSRFPLCASLSQPCKDDGRRFLFLF